MWMTRLLFGVALLVLAATAHAQGWPAKPIRLVVGFPPGGVADVLARLVAAPLGNALGQPVIVENRAGANGNLATEAVARAAPDGYTFLVTSGSAIVINPHLYDKMPVDPLRQLEPVTAMARVPVYLVVRSDLPASSVSEFLALARAKPGRLTYGTPGNGSSPHIAGELLQRASAVSIAHVPYKGAGPALSDLLAGQIDFWFDPGVGLQHTKSGKLRLLAVASGTRAPAFPDTPTLTEAGVPGVDADTWFAMYGPAGLDANAARRMHDEMRRILASAEYRARIVAMGADAPLVSKDEFARMLRSDSERFGALVRAAKIRAD